MKIARCPMLFGLFGLCVFAGAAAAEDAATRDGSTSEVESTTEATDYQSAAAIDFRSELKLSFDSLTSLGQRIELARRHADPVGLANAARELHVAEAVSGQTAAITSGRLMQEAVELARMRYKSAELKAVAMLATDKDAATKIEMLADEAEASEKEAGAAAKAGEKSRGIFNDLIVDNHSHDHVHIYYNGHHLGHLDPHEHKHFHVHDHGHGHFFDLQARGHYRQWSRHVHGDFRDYQWTIH